MNIPSDTLDIVSNFIYAEIRPNESKNQQQIEYGCRWCVPPIIEEMNTKAKGFERAVLVQIERIIGDYPDVQRLLDEGDLDVEAPEGRKVRVAV